MKGVISNQAIILSEPLPDDLQEGDEVEITVVRVRKQAYPVPVFELDIKDEYLQRERIYEPESHLS
ncbi:MAG: hypothetical protein ACFB0E_05215 [Leptolyngbyaceae cyanobacterium]